MSKFSKFNRQELEKKERLTTEELAFLRNKHPVTLAKERVNGDGPKFVKDGRYVYYLQSDFREWETKNTKRNTA